MHKFVYQNYHSISPTYAVLEKLSHLSQVQIAELIKKYYSGVKSHELISEFNLDVLPNQIHKTFPPRILSEECIHCQTNLIEQYPSKTVYNSRWGNSDSASCPNCGHERSKYCTCQGCKQASRIAAEEKQRQELIAKQEWKSRLEDTLSGLKETPVIYDSIDFDQKVYLGAVLRAAINESYNIIKPINSLHVPLAPNAVYENEILKRITKDSPLLLVSSESSPSTVFIEEDGITYYPKQVTWELNVISNDLPKVLLVDFIMNSAAIGATPEQKLELWHKIALEECLEYFTYMVLNTLNTDFTVGEKTNAVFSQLLKDYSTGQIYYIINYSIKQALLYKAERGVPNKQAANSVVTSAQSLGERAKAKGWDLTNYSRKTELPMSVVSRFYYEKVLGIADKGFSEKPNLSSCS